MASFFSREEIEKKNRRAFARERRRVLLRQRRMVEFMSRPLVSELCRTLYQGLVIIVPFGFLMDIAAYLFIGHVHSFSGALSNGVISASSLSLVIGLPLMLLSGIQLFRLSRGYEEVYYEFDEALEPISEEELALDLKPYAEEQEGGGQKDMLSMHPKKEKVPPRQKYIRYLQTAGISIACLMLLRLIFR